MSVNLSPIGNGFQFFDTNGKPLNAGLLNTYAAGSSTPQPTFTTNIGNVQNSNPIILGVDGRPPQEIWLTAGVAYKFVLTDSLSNLIGSYDNLIGINDINVSNTVNEWITGAFPGLTYISGTQFSIIGDQTSILTVNRRVKTTNTGGTIYGYITVSSFGGGVTTVTIVTDAGSLDSGLSIVAYGINNPTNPSIPQAYARRDIANTFSASNTFNKEIILGSSAEVATANTLQLVGNPIFHIPSTGSFIFKAPATGSGADRFKIYAGDGVTGGVVGCGTSGAEATGGAQGNGTCNFAGVYDNGTKIINVVPGGASGVPASTTINANVDNQNTTGKSIFVTVSRSPYNGADTTVTFKVGANTGAYITINSLGMGVSSSTVAFFACAIVPAGSYYRLDNLGASFATILS